MRCNRPPNIGDALNKLFSEFADDHTVTVYGEPSAELFERAEKSMPGQVQWYSFLNGFESEVTTFEEIRV